MTGQTVTLTIDGREVTAPAGSSLLHAALDAGIYVPHLCDHPDLPPGGVCRLCVVRSIRSCGNASNTARSPCCMAPVHPKT